MTRRTGRPIRVVHVIQNLNYGGMEKVLADLLGGLDRQSFESHVLTLRFIGRFGREAGVAARMHEGPPMSRFSLIRPAALARSLRRLAPDIVHTHSGVWYKTARAARMACLPRVLHTEHGKQSEARFDRFLDCRAARMTSAVVAVSRPLAHYLSERLRVPEQRITVIPNGVDCAVFAPGAASGALRRELGLPSARAIIGSIGRLEHVKGYDVLLRALRWVTHEGGCARDPVLVVAGEGRARASLEALSRDLGVQDRVFLLGWRDDSLNLLREFDCFALGSRSEGTSISLLEAMATGVPPAVTDVGGNADVLGPELQHQLAPPGDWAALGQRIVAALDPAQGPPIGARARRRVEHAFSLGAMVRRYEQLYEQLLAEPPGRDRLRRAAQGEPVS